MKLDGKVAVVTGASSGMGKEISLLFAKEGAKVIAVARRKERLEELVKASEPLPGTIVAYAGDVGQRSVNEDMINFAVKEFGKLDVLVNNAGVMDEMMPIAEVTDELWNEVQKVNVYGPMCACRKAVDVMLKQDSGGVIINVASIGGLHGGRAGIAYTASKHAVVGMTKNIGYTYANNKIRCNAICPGGVNTEIASHIKNPSRFGAGRYGIGMSTNPRMGEASEIAKVALFLASDDSSFVNATEVVADSGWSAY